MSFKTLGLSEEILKSIEEVGYENPSEIQKQAIPQVLMGRDILGCAQTGTGKTASFMLPLVEILSTGQSKSRMPRSLILAPTRELAMQVSEDFKLFNKYLKLQMALLIGGVSFSEQDSKLAKGVDVLVATPGRLLDHVERGKIILKDIKILVIDEADRMLDMGFIPDIEKITKLLPKIRQTLFFSATLSQEIRHIGENFLINPKEITVSPSSSNEIGIESFLIKTTKKEKLNKLEKILNIEKIKNAVIFCNKKIDINKVNTFLKNHKFKTVCLHGDMNQSSRINSLKEFKNGLADILVASDVAARGLDVAGLSHVFNYDVPNNPEDYVHRIGRTGRAGLSGKAFTLYDDIDEKSILMIEKLIKKKINIYNFDNSSNKVQHKQTNITEEKKSEKQDVIKSNKIKKEFP
ncbi:MAG: DEAD/DEAH box helicase, partial [Candidatus Puniceispirillales bacterium]